MTPPDPSPFSDAARAVRERLAAGEVATFAGGGEKPRIAAALLHELALAAPPRGIRVRGAAIVGDLDFACASLPALVLEDCDLEGRLDAAGAHLGALSLDRSRLGEVALRGAAIDGPLDLSFVRPLAEAAWIDASKTLIRGGVLAQGAVLRTPARRPRDQVRHWDHVYALRLSEAQVMGNLWLAEGFVGEGGLCLDETYVRGTVSLAHGSRLTRSEDDHFHPGDALHAYALRVDGMFAMNFGFAAEGRVFIINSKFASRVNIDGRLAGTRPGYDFKGRPLNSCAALMIEHCEIGTSLGLYDCAFDGGVSLAHSTIGNTVSLARTRVTNRSADGRAPAVTFEQARIGEDLLFGPGFAAEGEVSVARARIAGDLDLAGARLDNPAGFALDARRVRVAGEVRPEGLAEGGREGLAASGSIDFAGAEIA